MHWLLFGSGGVKDERHRYLPLPHIINTLATHYQHISNTLATHYTLPLPWSFNLARPLFEGSAAAMDSRNASLAAADRSMV
jgi:hypothetical protein